MGWRQDRGGARGGLEVVVGMMEEPEGRKEGAEDGRSERRLSRRRVDEADARSSAVVVVGMLG